jgi:NDP-sugar pyrophosphorylase family protein
MRAIIPVAGVGSRLRPHTYTVPKVLLNMGGKPIVGHILDRLTEDSIAGINASVRGTCKRANIGDSSEFEFDRMTTTYVRKNA